MTTFGDPEAAAVDILQADAALAGVVITTDLIGYSTGPWIQVTRTGGVPTRWMGLDNPILRFEVRADDKGAALDLANTARAAVFAACGTYTGNGLALYDADDEPAGMAWTPDDQSPDSARYVFALALVTRPQ